MRIIKDLNDPNLELAGGKGSVLLRLLQSYSNVPKLFVICPESDEDILANASLILKEFKNLNIKRVAVRSSANVEDRQVASFAGQFETRLNVTENSLIEAVRYVYASKNLIRAQAYAQTKNIDFQSVRMAVVVQCQIPSDVSGVCFTKYQHNNLLGLIEVCWGMGESIVSGKETPDRYIFNRNAVDEIYETFIGNQLFMVSPQAEVDWSRVDTQWETDLTRTLVPSSKRLRKKLLNSEIHQVAELALRIEKEQNYECADIEFCFYKGELYLLQARPGPPVSAVGI